MGRKNRNSGLTLVEILMVVLIMAIISLAVYSLMSNGIRIYQRTSRFLPEEDIGVFFDKFYLDFKNSFSFTGVNFYGGQDRVASATFVSSLKLNNKTVGRVTYYYDRAKKTLSREQQDISDIYTGAKGAVTDSINEVRYLKFSYYLYDRESESFTWQDVWARDTLPLAVRMELELDNGQQKNSFIKTVGIPASNCLWR